MGLKFQNPNFVILMQKSSKEKWLKKGDDYEEQPGPVSGATCLVGKVEKIDHSLEG